MTRPLPLLRASAAALPRRALALPFAAALALPAVGWPLLDTEAGAVLVLRGVALLLATALTLAADEPSAPLLDPTPTPLAHRLAARTAVGAALLLPAWAAALAAAAVAGDGVPVVAASVELAALAAGGLALPVALRRWRGTAEPAVVAGPVLLGALLAAGHLPQRLSLLPGSPLDPSWDAAHLRWAGVLAVAVALLAVAARDPATARRVAARDPATARRAWARRA